MGLPLTILAAWRGAWRVAAWALMALAIQYVLGVVATGGLWDWPLRWLNEVSAETGTDFAAVGWQVVGLPGMLSRIGGIGSTTSFALFVLGMSAGGILIFFARNALRRWDAPSAVALACALALFAGPRGWAYDPTLLLPAVAVVASRVSVDDPARRRQGTSLLVAGYVLVLVYPLGSLVGVNPAGIIVLAAPFVLLRNHRSTGVMMADDCALMEPCR